MEEFHISIDPGSSEVEELDAAPDTETGLQVALLVPKLCVGMAVELGRSSLEKTFLFVNKRPVEMKELEKVLRKVFSEAAGLETEKYPVCMVSVSLGPEVRSSLDANLEPNKQKVGLGCLPALLTGIEEFLRLKYGLLEPETGKEKIEPSDPVPINSEESYVSEELPVEMELPTDKSCFTMIGTTQAEEYLEDKENIDHLSISQFFPNPRENLKTSVLKPDEDRCNFDRLQNDEDLGAEVFESRNDLGVEDHESIEDLGEEGFEEDRGARRARSPVLRAEMFDCPDLPGLDAVYLNRFGNIYLLFCPSITHYNFSCKLLVY